MTEPTTTKNLTNEPHYILPNEYVVSGVDQGLADGVISAEAQRSRLNSEKYGRK